MLDIFCVDKDLITSIKWAGDPDDYDFQLSQLAPDYQKFLVINPAMDYYSSAIVDAPESKKCIVWFFEGQWVAKLFSKNWTPSAGYLEIQLSRPKMVWRKNPDLDRTLTFEESPIGNFEPEPWDWHYELVWYIDPRFNPLDDKIWAVKAKPSGLTTQGTKDMGYLSPKVEVDFNEKIPNLEIDLNQLYPPYYFLTHECIYYLDPQHTPNESLWAVKIRPGYKKVKEQMSLGTISIELTVRNNPELADLHFEIDYAIPYYDLEYKHVWMLDRKFLDANTPDTWAIEVCASPKVKGSKIIGSISPIPTIEFNKDLPNINYQVDYRPLYHDMIYEHIWYLDPSETSTKDKVWVAKLSYVDNPIGTKDMGYISTGLSKHLDVIFISYKEPNAEKNWQRVLEKAPYAKRVDGVKGIFEAHKVAAKMSTTDMFYVVDGDAYLVDDFKFNYQPDIFDRDCVYIWTSLNPVNHLKYGYGGVKLFPKKSLMKLKTWSVDLTAAAGSKIHVFDQISNITAFNTSAFTTWRSAFRECVKLSLKDDPVAKKRLEDWQQIRPDAEFSDWARLGVEQALDYITKNKKVKCINDFQWLEQYFNRLNHYDKKKVK